jgi:TatD DNase family protein
MIDFHCHLDLYKNPISLLPEVQKRCRFVLAVTTSPRAFLKTSQVFADIDCISVGLGLHPEILADRINEEELFFSLISKSRYIGEIGLDGTARNKASLDLQIDFFRNAIQASEEGFVKLISIHSRSAVKGTLEIIEQNIKASIPILHWFSGNEKELDWALSLNCWFSINPLMISSAKGISLIKKVPISKMLPETDGPFTSHDGIPYMPWDSGVVVEGIAKHKGLSIVEVSRTIAENLKVLL